MNQNPEIKTSVESGFDARSYHAVRALIDQVLADSHGLTSSQVSDRLMRVLDELRLVSYRGPDVLPLLTAPARTLVMLMEDPSITVREMALRVGTTEGNVQRSITRLIEAKLIVRTKVLGRNRYVLSWDQVLNHPDIWRMVYGLGRGVPDLPETTN